MRIKRLWIGQFKNLINVNVQFDPSKLTTVLIGRNGSGKSNFLEALVQIFKELDLKEMPSFDYVLEYECNGHQIVINAHGGVNKNIELMVDQKPMLYSIFVNDPNREFLPRNVFGYYSGTSKRLERYFEKHQEAFYYKLLDGKRPPLRPLFYARPIHSQYVLLAFFSFEDKEAAAFLKKYLGIVSFENAEFILKQPRWYKKKNGDESFWGARGVVRGFMEDLYSHSFLPIKDKVRVTLEYGQSRTEERLYLRIKNLESLLALANKYKTNVEFFKTLESTYISDLIHALVIRVNKEGVTGKVEFAELSEGEQQLLTVLGLLRFTKEQESLFLLDEPDTHLNPAWKLEYVSLLQGVVEEKDNSHIILVTHDPLIVGGLKREQVQIFSVNGPDKRVNVNQPEEDPVGMGVAALLTSDIFGLPTALDLETQKKLDRKSELSIKENPSAADYKELEKLNEELDKMGFLVAFRDPLYSKFVKATKEYDQLRRPALTKDDRAKQAELARDIVAKLKEEEA